VSTAGVSVRPLRRDEYERLVEAGHFQRERIELLRGRLIAMSPQKAAHATTLERLNDVLHPPLVGRARVRIQSPLALLDDSEPEPDLAVVSLDDHRLKHPVSALLVVEVSESSLDYDRTDKARVYAEAGIPEYWVVNLVDDLVEAHLEPVRGRYLRVVPYGRGQTLAPSAFPDLAVAVSDILPPPGRVG
jgi:Uma2 family endonuclease